MPEISEAGEMPEVIIDEQFKALLTPLDPEAYARLEIDIIEHGIIYPLLLWNGVLIDGYNRWSIASAHNISFKVEHMEFDTREEVKIWIITNQVSRRNLAPMQLSYFRGKHYHLEKQIISNTGGKNQFSEVGYQTDTQPPTGKTAVRLAEQYSVSQITILRDAQLAQTIDTIGEISPEAKEKILSGEANISRTRLQELHLASEQELTETIEMILDGTHKARISKQSDDSSDDPDSQENKSIKTIIGKIATEVAGVQTIANKPGADKAKELKPALRSLIDMLEKLYSSIQ